MPKLTFADALSDEVQYMENCALTVLHKSYLPIFFKGVCKYQCTRWVNNTNLVQMA